MDTSNFSRVGSVCDSDKKPPTTRNLQRAKSRFGPSRDYKSQDAAPWASEAPPLPRWPSLGPALGTASSRFLRFGRAMDPGFCWFGGEFEDSVFEERRERRSGPSGAYRAKCCEPQVRERSLSVPLASSSRVRARGPSPPGCPRAHRGFPVTPSPHEARASPETTWWARPSRPPRARGHPALRATNASGPWRVWLPLSSPPYAPAVKSAVTPVWLH